MVDETRDSLVDAPVDALEPEAAVPGHGVSGRVQRSEVWRSVFRHPQLDTPRGRALQGFSNFFLHLYPVKVPARVLRLRYSFRLGFIATMLFAVLVVTGVYLMFVYTPSPSAAYGNMQHLKTDVGFGQLIRNVHRWSAHLMVLVVVLHLVRVFYAGAYKRPRQFNWVLGVVLLLITLGLSFTGYLLPWDQLSYWAVTVGTNLVHYVPVVGNTLQDLLIGGDQVGAEHAAALLRAARGGAARAADPRALRTHLAGAQGRLRGAARGRRRGRPRARPRRRPSRTPLTVLYGERTRLLGVVDRESVTAEDRGTDDTVFTLAAPRGPPRGRRARRVHRGAGDGRRVRRAAARARQPEPHAGAVEGTVVLLGAPGAAVALRPARRRHPRAERDRARARAAALHRPQPGDRGPQPQGRGAPVQRPAARWRWSSP